jgi:Tol biopolymer transport system component
MIYEFGPSGGGRIDRAIRPPAIAANSLERTMRRLFTTITSLAYLTLLACAEGTGPTSRLASTAKATADISDAAHNGGNKNFYFLPPMVGAPTPSGVFDATVSPRVTICEWTGAGCATTIAVFSMTAGTASQIIRLDLASQLYIVNWDTRACVSGPCTLDPAKTYRVEVAANDITLGHADVDVVANGSALKNVQTNEYVALVDGRTLPIKFRIEQGALAPTGPTGSIVVMSSRFGGWRVVIMNADGSNARLVTTFEPQDDAPVPDLSPDGKTVVFASGRQVWKADVATGAVTQLTFEGAYTRYGKWSPDGQKIAFNSLRNNGHNLYIMNPDGSGVQQVTNDADDEYSPTWSPDGRRLAFLSARTGVQQLYVVDIATGAERQVTFDPGTHNSPRWSQNSTLVAYMKDNSIWVVDVDNGLPPTQLTTSVGNESEPCFSPDGTEIIFDSTRIYGRSQLWSVKPDGSNLHLFIGTPFSETSPSWR